MTVVYGFYPRIILGIDLICFQTAPFRPESGLFSLKTNPVGVQQDNNGDEIRPSLKQRELSSGSIVTPLPSM